MSQLKSLMPTDFPSLGIPWLMQAGAMLYGKAQVAERLPVVANVVISNVPGPPMPLYMAGARMLTNYPTSIAVHGLALNITVQTYNQSLDIGVMACAHACPETAELAAYIDAAFMEFQALPVPEVEVAAEPAALPRKRAPAKKAVTKATPRPRTSTSRKKATAG
jgi:diacylglycerol O-acyltransferase / wax synthase